MRHGADVVILIPVVNLKGVMRRLVTVTAVFLSPWSWRGAFAQGTLRIGMTASGIPYTGGQADNGFEGFASSATRSTSP
jgi:hypothetical protein